MRDKTRRVRTGCLTCKARRVKCDEQVPVCGRCLAANVECAGYERRRVVSSAKTPGDQGSRALPQPRSFRRGLRPHVSVTADEVGSGTTAVQESRGVPQSAPKIPDTRSALVAFPSNPRLDQSPVLPARYVLGYQQSVLWTLPILFEPDALHFWRDDILQRAWDCEYLFLTIVSLGNVHRAARLAVSDDEQTRAFGLDLKITAVQFYTNALEELGTHLQDAKRTPLILVATLCLMAYFEAFAGNSPAFAGRVATADHYFANLMLADGRTKGSSGLDERGLASIQDCLRSLAQVCYVVLPLSRIHGTIKRNTHQFYPAAPGSTSISPTPAAALQSLSGLVDQDPGAKEVIWNSVAPYARNMPIEALDNFEAKLLRWRHHHQHLIPELDTDSALNTLLTYRWQRFAMPPPVYTTTTRQASLTAAHYNFYLGRTKWAQLLHDHEPEKSKLMAEFHFYEALRHVASHVSRFFVAPQESPDAYIPCEALKIGLLPLLHITGLCSPEPTWLHWIRDTCELFVQEGVLKGHTFATDLDCLHTFETVRHNSNFSASAMDQYPSPSDRVISQLIPEIDGSHFTSYFAAPIATSLSLGSYHVIGHARWRCSHDETRCTPDIKIYDEETANATPFSEDWLYSTPPAIAWQSSCTTDNEFSFERALQDHINGTRLLLAAEGSAGGHDESTQRGR